MRKLILLTMLTWGGLLHAHEPAASEKIEITVNGVSFNMVKVSGGTFFMGDAKGDSDEKPVHRVTVSDYYIGETEVTQDLWTAVMGSNPSHWRGGKLPVENVSWEDVQSFIQQLNDQTNKNFRLPTEAEWEFAAKGGNASKGYQYSGSNNIDNVAWYYSNSKNKTHEVATKQPNELGIYDMSGNVWEWCQDYYGLYTQDEQLNPTGPASGTRCVKHGGGWNNLAISCRPANRENFSTAFTCNYLGFRLVL